MHTLRIGISQLVRNSMNIKFSEAFWVLLMAFMGFAISVKAPVKYCQSDF